MVSGGPQPQLTNSNSIGEGARRRRGTDPFKEKMID
jgi:hypothetical protein